MVKDLHGKNIIITGASGGIGEKMARLCAERGANLALVARRTDKLAAMKEELEQRYSIDIYTFSLDVSNMEKVEEVFPLILERFKVIDVLVNNAGYGIFTYAHDADMKEVKGMFDVNVLGLIACTQQVLPKMLATKSGHIINIASQAGKIATPKSSTYSATKHAVLGYSNSLRMEVASQGVYITTVNPGPIETNFFDIADKEGTYVKNVQRYMLKAEYVARKVVDVMLTPTREVNLPRWMNLGSKVFAIAPRLFEWAGRGVFNKK
ncbi:SDR family oxidoreductase [Cytobacillus sp. OWB-43]|uniref:SDR family NAD(P)-dependent oxidoreductase n=1 Tax=Cytobacillus sp. OWB-43 TaxID=3108468 RepID=UPI002AFE0A60|nr:SDR family oxidoreductase [Cytobacillus sp. OWB-43]MEA1852988.1 SDR family oxidoreductase [Cytobacillus sp. OWB-43]